MAPLLFLVLLSSILSRSVSGYCWAAGRNPGFTGPPRVEQLKVDVVRVSWHNVVKLRECADNFVVKYWPRSAPNQYEITELVPNAENFTDITVIPKIYYQYQAVAREDKGVIGGVDWNKSPTVDFKTSSYGNQVFDSNVSPEMIEYLQQEGHEDSSKRQQQQQSLYEQSEQTLVLGLSVEVFVGCTVILIVVVLILAGIVYRVVSGDKRKFVVAAAEDELDKSGVGIEDAEIQQSEMEEMAPEKNLP